MFVRVDFCAFNDAGDEALLHQEGAEPELEGGRAAGLGNFFTDRIRIHEQYFSTKI